jgi:rare lipoprotein A
MVLMKKFIASLILIVATSSVAKADDWLSNYNGDGFKFSESRVESKSVRVKKYKKTKVYVPEIAGAYQSGMASFYWQPQAVACGGRFNPEAMTAASKHLKCGTKVRVINKRNGKSVVVTINDRGPYVKGRIIDLSKAAARQIAMINSGVVPVSVEVISAK